MKITTILGIPRLRGNTAHILKIFKDRMTAMGHRIDRINIIKYKLKDCIGCDKFQKITDQPGCVQKDDIMSFFETNPDYLLSILRDDS